MNLERLVAVSGLPGLYRVAVNRNNGLIIEDLETAKRRFAPSRKHQFTPLESISIYTDSDSKELSKVFESMLEQLEDNPPVGKSASKEELKEYFADILPDYDRDRVFPNDMKKVVKWFTYLNDINIWEELQKEPEVSEEESTEEETKT